MTKAAICVHCMDIFSPSRNGEDGARPWRWCECEHSGVRWRHGTRGLLEVTSLHGPDNVRVLGLNNSFLLPAILRGKDMGWADWRAMHQTEAASASGYLFHTDKRDCWALVVRPGESSDVFFIPYAEARHE